MTNIDLQDPNVHSIDRINPGFVVLWLLGTECTYSCSYCPEYFHNGAQKYHSTDIVLKTLELLKDIPNISVTFSGGEATFHPDFEYIVLNRPKNIKINVVSNASRPIAFWERIGQELSVVTLTYHSEFAKLDRFAATADLLYNKYKRIGFVNLTMNPKMWDSCVETYTELTSRGIRVMPKPLVDNFGFKSSKIISDYSAEQLEWMQQHTGSSSILKNIQVYDRSGNVIQTTNQFELLSNKQTNFSGWQCWAPTRCLYIDPDGRVFDTSCLQRKHLGNIYTGFKIRHEPTVCRTEFCWCHMDILTKKVKLEK